MKKLSFLLIAFSLLTFSCKKDASSSDTKIIVTVKKDGVVQNNVSVFAEKQGGGFSSDKNSNSSGKVEFTGLTAGIYDIDAYVEDDGTGNSLQDYETVTLSDKETKNVTLDLQ